MATGRSLSSRARALLGPDVATLGQGLVALCGAAAASLVAGFTLGSIEGTLRDLPGLLVLVPAAIGMRGHIFGALGSRLGTAIHTGTFTLARRRDTVVGQNVLATLVLTLTFSLAVALLAKAAAVAFHVQGSISVADFVAISMGGGVLASIGLLGFTLGLAALATRYEWDLDNVAAPLVTAAGDMLTLPSLYLATFLARRDVVTPAFAIVVTVATLVALVTGLRSKLPLVVSLVRESLPIHGAATVIGTIAGLAIEKRLDAFRSLPALLVLVPPFLATTGALGGILSSRLSSKLHLGIVDPVSFPPRAARDDMRLVLAFAVPMLVVVALATDAVARVAGLASPGPLRLVAVTVLAGLATFVFASTVVYYGSVAVYRLGLDPDNIGIPLVTSSVDLTGSFALVLGIVALGLTG
ncbi:MAG TPA: magnesium transporter [Acidimicrobiales bacterium]